MTTSEQLSLAEQVLLVGLHDEKGSDLTSMSVLDKGVAGAALVDLLSAGAIVEDGGKLAARDGGTLRDPFLIAIHRELAAEGEPHKPGWWLDRLPKRMKPFREAAAARLVASGVLGHEHRKVLGLFPTTSFPERDGAAEAALRSAMRDVLVVGRGPTEPEAQLIGLLSALDLIPRLVDKDNRREAKRRAKEVAESGIVSEAIRKAIQDVNAAVMTAVMASTVATTAGSG